MSAIKQQAFQLAQEEAHRLWAYCGAQYFENDEMLREVSLQVLRSISVFALNCRRILESFDESEKFKIDQIPWGKSLDLGKIDNDLWSSTNLVIHANDIKISFPTLMEGAYINGAKVIGHAEISTDRKLDRRVSPFGMAYVFLSEVVPAYREKSSTSG